MRASTLRRNVWVLDRLDILPIRGVEGEDIEATIHATLIDSLEGDEVVLLDTMLKLEHPDDHAAARAVPQV